MELFRIGFLPVGLVDLLDILVVSFIFYQVWSIMRGTRATQMFTAFIILLVAGGVAQMTGMAAMSWLIQSIGAVWVIAFVILFQPELRRVMVRMGQIGMLRTLLRGEQQRVIGEIVKAAGELSRKRIGGLMVIQRRAGIRGIVETGVRLQADLRWETLLTIFHPRTPLHDGAVIISGETILAARCILPLADVRGDEGHLGMRHRAALGVTQELDAISVVISEETGQISVAADGRFIERGLDETQLAEVLKDLLLSEEIPLHQEGLLRKGRKVSST